MFAGNWRFQGKASFFYVFVRGGRAPQPTFSKNSQFLCFSETEAIAIERYVIKTRSRGKTLQECETVLLSQFSIHHSVLGLVMQLLYWLLICPMGGDTCVGEFLLMRTSMITMMTTMTLQTMNLSPPLPPGSHLSPQVGLGSLPPQ